MIAEVNAGRFVDPRSVHTVGELVEHWLEVRRSEVKASTFQSYGVVAKLITGPVLEGSPSERAEFTATGKKPTRNARLLPMLGRVKANELSTAAIRRWHGLVKTEVGRYSANRALPMLKSALALGEEDFGIRAPAMPTNFGRRQARSKKWLLSLEQVGQLVDQRAAGFTLTRHRLRRWHYPHSAHPRARWSAHGSHENDRLHAFSSDVAYAQTDAFGLESPMLAFGWRIASCVPWAGHADPSVTLSVCSQPLRDGAEAVKALEAAYQ